MERRHPQVVNVDEVEGRVNHTGTRFGATLKELTRAAGGQELGCLWHEVPPGRAAWPHHWHGATEEAMFVLEGEGVLRIGIGDNERQVALRAGDYIAYPCGPQSAHQVRNTSERPLRYLCFSNRPKTDVVGYPDSNKIMARTTGDDDPWTKGSFWARELYRRDTAVGYFDGEDTGAEGAKKT